MERSVLLPALAFSLAASTAHGAPDRIDIVTIFEQFLAAGTAAKHCNTFDGINRENWLRNYQVVIIRAAMAIKERNPDVSQADLTSRVKAKIEGIRTKIEAEASTDGCTSPHIEQLLKLYQIQAGLDLN